MHLIQYLKQTMIRMSSRPCKLQLITLQEIRRRKPFSPDRTLRVEKLWELIYDNMISSYENELSWLNKVREEVMNMKGESK